MEESKEKTAVCKFCNKKFPSRKSLGGHIRIHNNVYSVDSSSYNGNQSDTETSSTPTRKRSKRKRVTKLSNSESFSYEIDQELKDGAFSLMMMSRDPDFEKGYDLVVTALAESSDNNSVILGTKSSSRKQLKIDKVAVFDHLRCADDSESSDSDSKKKRKIHKCPVCLKVFKSGNALGGHKRSHSMCNQELRIEHQAEIRIPIDLNLPALNIDE